MHCAGKPGLKALEVRAQIFVENLLKRSVRLDIAATDSAGTKYNENPTGGYGIFAETMLEQGREAAKRAEKAGKTRHRQRHRHMFKWNGKEDPWHVPRALFSTGKKGIAKGWSL